MKKQKNKIVCFSFLFLVFFSALIFSQDLYLNVQRGGKTTIGLPEFINKNPSPEQTDLKNQLYQTVKQDILYANLFNLADTGPDVSGTRIDFNAWSQNNVDLLVTGTVHYKKEMDSVNLTASVFELPSGNPVFQKNYSDSVKNIRQIAHAFTADFLYRFTGERGVSESRIAFVNNHSGNEEIYVIDYDGENLQRVTRHKNLVVLPRWSPDFKSILYTSYHRGNMDLYLYSLDRNQSAVISQRAGLNTAACFAPSGQEIAATLSFKGYPNLYLLDLQGKIKSQLTHSKSVDTSPSFSPDGRKITFTSDRPGTPQIYMMNVDGSHLERITESGYCDSPVWSPRGDKIAYSCNNEQGQHNIMIYDIPSGQTVQITSNSRKNENPSFSPDGRFLVFSSARNRKTELFISTLDGAVQKKLADIPGHSFTPSWAP